MQQQQYKLGDAGAAEKRIDLCFALDIRINSYVPYEFSFLFGQRNEK
jgi:hypothetical protein